MDILSGNHGNYDYWVVKISDTGHLQWQKCMGGANYVPDDCINSLIAAAGGGYVVAGFTNSTNLLIAASSVIIGISDLSWTRGDYTFNGIINATLVSVIGYRVLTWLSSLTNKK